MIKIDTISKDVLRSGKVLICITLFIVNACDSWPIKVSRILYIASLLFDNFIKNKIHIKIYAENNLRFKLVGLSKRSLQD